MGKIVESFDQFLQQAELAQIGDPNIFAEKLKKTQIKKKKLLSSAKPKS